MNNNLKPVTTLPPFKRLCMSIGELPTSYLDTMTYYEMLVWFTEYMKNTVIPTINNNGEAVSELQSLYTQLHDYVENYFDNLDVQEEINNKLDKMAQDGSLTLLIKNYVDPILNSYQSDVNEQIDTFKTSVNSQINEIDAKVDAVGSGSPLVASSTSEMTETDRVYVNTTDGKWYYYDGDSWEIGGTYQSAEDSDTVSELVDQVNYIKGLDNEISLDPDDFERGGLNSDGQKYSSGYQYYVRSTDYIAVEDKEFPIKFNIKSGFQFLVHYYSSNQDGTGYHTLSSGWQSTLYTLNTEQNYYKLLIRRNPVIATEEANVEEFVSKLYIDNNCDLFTAINSIIHQESKYNLPSYWETYLSSKYSSINNAIYGIGNHGDYFGFFTDYHISQSSGLTNKICYAIKENTLLNRFINNGDILNTHTKSESLTILNNFKNDFKDIKLLNLLGNHDLNTYAVSDTDKLTISEVYPILFKQYEDTYIHLNKNLYYYYDDDTQKMRYIFLNTNYGESAFLRDLDQMNWFIDLLNSNPADYGVTVITHIYFGSVDANYDLVESPVGERLRTVLNAFNNKTSGSHHVSTSGAENTITFDFTNASGYVICVITGHTHNDGYLEADGYPVIASVCDAYDGSNQNPSVTRTQGTYTENAIDLFFINTTTKTISTIRIGAGSDRTFTYGD